MDINLTTVLLTALVPLLVGMLWYSQLLFGNVWMRENKLTPEMLKGSPIKIFGLTYLFSIFLALMMHFLTIHQFGPLGMIGGPEFIADAKPSYAAFMEDYGNAYRTFKHGALHGFMSGIFLVLPLLGITALFERKSWRYILIHLGYWTIVFTLMGGLVCMGI